MRIAALALFVFAVPVAAAPPPPPMPGALDTVQAFLRATTGKDARSYGNLLADAFVGTDAGRGGEAGKAEWIDAAARDFTNGRLDIRILDVYYGGRTTASDTFQVMIVENVDNFSFGVSTAPDCCAFYRTETLTLGRDDHIVRIDRSALYDTILSKTGGRTDLTRP